VSEYLVDERSIRYEDRFGIAKKDQDRNVGCRSSERTFEVSRAGIAKDEDEDKDERVNVGQYKEERLVRVYRATNKRTNE